MARFKCPDCRAKVSISAAVCPKCGRPVSEADRAGVKASEASRKKFMKWIGYGFLIIFGLSVFQTLLMSPEERARIEAAEVEKEQREQARRAAEEQKRLAKLVRITAVQLVEDYDANELFADKRYNGKETVITGVVTDISKSDTGLARLTLEGPKMFQNVLADLSWLEESDFVDSLRKGQEISLLCIVRGAVLGRVLAVNCSPLK